MINFWILTRYWHFQTYHKTHHSLIGILQLWTAPNPSAVALVSVMEKPVQPCVPQILAKIKPVSQQLLDSRGRGGNGKMLMQYSDTRILYLISWWCMMWYFSILQTLHIIIFNECRKPQGLAVILYNI